MKKKGFTLIELLAVIVILAIIALIATPIILNIISDSREESNKRSVELYASSVEQAIAKYQLNNNESISETFTTTDGKILTKQNDSTKTMNIEYDGNVVCDKIEIYTDGNIYLGDCTVNGGDKKYSHGELIAGAYDDNNNLIADWDTLVNIYGLDVENGSNSEVFRNEALKNVTKLVISDSVTYIGDSAFFGCTSLTSIAIPDSVTYIDDSAFSGCTSLTSITIPDSVTYIGFYAFGGTGLTSATFNNPNGWEASDAFNVDSEAVDLDLSDPTTNATYFKDTYIFYNWKRS